MTNTKLITLVKFDEFGEMTGIFNYLYRNYENDLYFFSKQDFDYKNIQLEYYLGRSGNKNISILYNNLLKQYNDNDIVLSILSRIIFNNYGANWNKIFNAYTEDYNALHNYDMEESETFNTDENVEDSTHSSEKVKVKSTNYRTGFNTDEPVLDTQSLDEKLPEDNFQDEESNSTRNTTTTRTQNRSGNIGVTTSQKMLTEELEVRKYNFIKMVMRDIDKILCSKIYDVKGEF